MSVVILAVVFAGLWVIARWDRPLLLSRKHWMWILAVAFLEGVAICVGLWGRTLWEWLWMSIFAGCLLLASVTDLMSCQVYNFVWWIGFAAAMGLLWCRIQDVNNYAGMCTIINGLVCFCGLQIFLFKRMYGRADCYAFAACAVAQGALGITLVGYLWQMLCAYILLGVVQGAGRNIARNGNLKQPVPFLPYIMVSFWVIVLSSRWC